MYSLMTKGKLMANQIHIITDSGKWLHSLFSPSSIQSDLFTFTFLSSLWPLALGLQCIPNTGTVNKPLGMDIIGNKWNQIMTKQVEEIRDEEG